MSETPSRSRVFDALAHPYRRQLLLALYEANPQQDDDLDPLNLLADSQTIDDLTVTQISLEHAHLPKLHDLGFVEWDRASGELSKGPNWHEIAPLLRLIDDHRDELPAEWFGGPAGEA